MQLLRDTKPHHLWPRAVNYEAEASNSAKITILPDGTIVIEQGHENFSVAEVGVIDDRAEDIFNENVNDGIGDDGIGDDGIGDDGIDDGIA